MKNRSTNQLISTLVLTSLVLSILPTHLTLSGKTPAQKEDTRLKIKIKQKIKTINKTIKRLKAAKVAVPLMAIGAGAAFATLVIAVAIGFGLIFKKKLLPDIIKSLEELTKKISYKKERIEGLQNKIIPMLQKFLQEHESQTKRYIRILNRTEEASKAITRLGKELKQETQEKTLLKLKIAAVIGVPISAALVSFFGSIAVSLWPLFGLSNKLVKESSNGVAWLEQIKKDHPGLLTPQQERTLNKFKKISKDTKVLAIIQNLRLEAARNEVIDKAMTGHTALLALFEKKKLRKLFIDYIKLKWEANILQKAMGKDTKASSLLGIKRKLSTTQKKIKKMEHKHASLKQIFLEVFQAYEKQANIVLEELKKKIIEEQKKKLKIQAEPQPIISL